MDKYERTVGFDFASEETVSPLLFGTNLEHTRSCLYKGLSAQMLRNRKFAGKPVFLGGYAKEWYPIGEDALFVFDESYTRHHEIYRMQRSNERNSQRVVNAVPGNKCGIGQHEIALEKGKSYVFAAVAKVSAPAELDISLTSRDGKTVYARACLPVSGDEWTRYETVLPCPETDPCADIRISFTEQSSVCLGALSLLPEDNFLGMRRDVIGLLKRLGVKLVRWPGGNFAGEYNWFDGLLPVDMRSPLKSFLDIETQPENMGYDMSEIGIDEFIALCREIGAEPFVTINPCWNTPEDNAAFVEYCNGGKDTVYGALRISRGHTEPYNVKKWSLGNEFGYGHMEGENTPEGYQRIARRNAESMLSACPGLDLCSSGPYPNEDWMDKCGIALKDLAPTISQHFYAHNPLYPAVGDFRAEYEKCVFDVYTLRDILLRDRAHLPEDVSVSMDEWNVWYAWNRKSNVTDGIFCALNLQMLLSLAKEAGISRACQFEAVNEGLIEVSPSGAKLTAQGEMFRLMGAHMGGRVLAKSGKYEYLATEKDGIITLTAINPAYESEMAIAVPDFGKLKEAKLYTSEKVIPPSDFEIKEISPRREEGKYIFDVPPHSVVSVKIEAE